MGGEVDVGLGRLLVPAPGLIADAVGHCRLRVALPADHRLARLPDVELSELAGETIVVWGRPGRSSYTDFLMDMCRHAGFEPQVEVNPIQGTPPITAVVDGDRVAFVTEPPGPTADGSVIVLDIRPEQHVPLTAMRLDRSRSPVVLEFLSAVAATSG